MSKVLKKEVLGKELFRHPFGWCTAKTCPDKANNTKNDKNLSTLLICGSAVVDLNSANVIAHVDPEDRLAAAVATTSFDGDLYFLSEFDESDEADSASSANNDVDIEQRSAYWVCKWIPPDEMENDQMGTVEKLIRIDQDVAQVSPALMLAQLAVSEKFVAVLWTTATGPSLAAVRSKMVPAQSDLKRAEQDPDPPDKKKGRTCFLHVVSRDGLDVHPVPPATHVLAQVTGGVASNQPQAVRAKLADRKQSGGNPKLCYVCVALRGSSLALGMADGDIVFFNLTETVVDQPQSSSSSSSSATTTTKATVATGAAAAAAGDAGGASERQQHSSGVVVVPELNVQRRLCWHTGGGLRTLVWGPGPETTLTTGLPALLYSAGDEGVLVAWHLSTGEHTFIPRLGNKGPIAALSLSPDALHVAIGSADGSVVLVDTAMNTGQLVVKGSDITVCKLTCLSVPIAEQRTVEHVVACLCNEQVTLYSLPKPSAAAAAAGQQRRGQQQDQADGDGDGDNESRRFLLHETEIAVARATYCCVGMARDSAGPVTFLYIATHSPSTLQVWRLVDNVAATAKDPFGRFSLYAIILQPHGSPSINSLVHHPSRPHVFTTARDGRWRCWQPMTDPATGRFSGKMGCQFAGVYRGMSCTNLTVSPCGSLLSILYGSEVTLWQPTGSGRLERVLYAPGNPDDSDEHQELVKSQFLSGSFDNNWDMGDSEPMLVACSRSRLFVWNLVSCSLLWQLDVQVRFLDVHPRRPSAFFVLPVDGAGAAQPLLTLYDAGNGRSDPRPLDQYSLPEPMFDLAVIPRKAVYSRTQCPLVGLPDNVRHRSLVRLVIAAADDNGDDDDDDDDGGDGRRRNGRLQPPATPEPIFASAKLAPPSGRSLAVPTDSVLVSSATAAVKPSLKRDLFSASNGSVVTPSSSSSSSSVASPLAKVAKTTTTATTATAVPAIPLVNPFADAPAPSAAPDTKSMFDSLLNSGGGGAAAAAADK